MMNTVSGGRTNYGIAVGIIMLETKFPRIPGDIGNASTFSFPVLYKVVKGASAARILIERDPSLLKPFIDAGKELCKEGVKIVSTSCGFLAMFHRELSHALDVPVFTSSLVQIPLVYSVTGCRRVGILTANSDALTDLHFESVGVKDIPLAVEGVQNTYWYNQLFNNFEELDVAQAERDVVDAAKRLVVRNSDIGAIIFECTNLPPYAKSVQKAVGLPVFDIVTLLNMAHEAVTRQEYKGTI